MTDGAAGHQVFPGLCAFQRPCCGVVNFCAAQQTLLKRLRVLADIMGIAQHIAPLRSGTQTGRSAGLFPADVLPQSVLFRLPECVHKI